MDDARKIKRCPVCGQGWTSNHCIDCKVPLPTRRRWYVRLWQWIKCKRPTSEED